MSGRSAEASVAAGAWAVLATLAVIGAARPAAAQSDGLDDSRRLLLVQAQDARVAGDHARSLELATRAGAIGMTPSLRLFIAEEEAAVGEVGEATRAAMLCTSEASANHALNNRQAIIAQCGEIVASLRARVAVVVLHLGSARADGLELRVAGRPVNAVLLDTDYPVTPGPVVITARTASSRFETRVTAVVGTRQIVEIVLRADGESAASASPSDPSEMLPAHQQATTPRAVPTATSNDAPSTGGAARTFSFVALAVGAADVIASGVTYAYLRAAVLQGCGADGFCETGTQVLRANASAPTLNGVTYATLATGSAMLVAAAVALVVSRSRDGSPSARRSAVRVAAFVIDGFGAIIGGAF